MRTTRLFWFFCVAAFSITLASAQSLVTVYEHDFESPVGPEWSRDDRDETPIGARTFLGRFAGEPAVLELHDLPDHCTVTVSFELFIIDSWEGSVGWNAGPDVWDLNVSSGPPIECTLENLIHTSYANCVCDYQAYPEDFPNVHNRGLTDADEIDTLGYSDDSVYYLSFSFYHDAADLYFTFQGSPDLQSLSDESWGIDNIVVEMDTDQLYCCRAMRTLPVGYGISVPVPVSIYVDPDPRAEAFLVEETPPATWLVTGIDSGGIFESSTGKIKWGPFFDNLERTLSYSVTPPIGSTGPYEFAGVISVDGESEPICGEQRIWAGSYHPADTDIDWLIEANEVTAYAEAWLDGDPWTDDDDPIPADFVTNAGMIWRAGEAYTFNASVWPPWVATTGVQVQAGTATGDLGPSPGGTLVSITVVPQAGTTTVAVEDALPPGWAVADISHGGRLDAVSQRVKWGPLFGSDAQTLTYKAIAPAGAIGVVRFNGLASFDGVSVAIQGARTLDEQVAGSTD